MVFPKSLYAQFLLNYSYVTFVYWNILRENLHNKMSFKRRDGQFCISDVIGWVRNALSVFQTPIMLTF